MPGSPIRFLTFFSILRIFRMVRKRRKRLCLVAERVGFEPTNPGRGLRFSRPVQSTALPPLRKVIRRFGPYSALLCRCPEGSRDFARSL